MFYLSDSFGRNRKVGFSSERIAAAVPPRGDKSAALQLVHATGGKSRKAVTTKLLDLLGGSSVKCRIYVLVFGHISGEKFEAGGAAWVETWMCSSEDGAPMRSPIQLSGKVPLKCL